MILLFRVPSFGFRVPDSAGFSRVHPYTISEPAVFLRASFIDRYGNR
jgi:hypothetical protein